MACKGHALYCFDVLASYFEDKKHIKLRDAIILTHDGEAGSVGPSPLFVTWNTIVSTDSDGSNDAMLRGCIGTFESLELENGLAKYALISAFQDTRFSPIRAQEIPTLQCEVSILTDFEDIGDVYDWDLGIHGLKIQFTYNHSSHSSTFLPHVATEQGWNKQQTLISLLRKGGYRGNEKDPSKIPMKIQRYRGTKSTISYTEYKSLLASSN